MPKLKPEQITKFMSNSEMNHNSIWSKARNLAKLEAEIKATLPAPLNQNFGLANIQNQQATLYTKSSAWCYKIRLHSSVMTKFLKKKGISVNKIKVIVIPASDDLQSNSLPKPTISAKSKEILALARDTIENPELQKTFDKLLKD